MRSLIPNLMATAAGCLLLGVGSGEAAGQFPGKKENVQPQPGLQRTVGWLAYRNDTGMPIIVQGAAHVNGRIMMGPAHPINPGGAAWDQVAGAGAKIISVYDAKQKPLFSGPVNFTGQSLFFSIQLDVAVRGNERLVRAKLVPVPVPNMMPNNRALQPKR